MTVSSGQQVNDFGDIPKSSDVVSAHPFLTEATLKTLAQARDENSPTAPSTKTTTIPRLDESAILANIARLTQKPTRVPDDPELTVVNLLSDDHLTPEDLASADYANYYATVDLPRVSVFNTRSTCTVCGTHDLLSALRVRYAPRWSTIFWTMFAISAVYLVRCTVRTSLRYLQRAIQLVGVHVPTRGITRFFSPTWWASMATIRLSRFITTIIDSWRHPDYVEYLSTV
jgi:hypothetical protein